MPLISIWTAIKTLAGAANGMLSIVPALVWAALLVGAMVTSCVERTQRDHARAEAKTAKAELKTIKDAVQAQNVAAAKLLKEKTDEAKALETQLAAFRAAPEKTDAQNKATVADLGRKLRAAGRLRDPGGASGGSAASQGAAPATDSAGHVAEGAGVLSEALTAMLLADYADSDAINLAYASARADALNLRAQMAKLGSCTP